MSAQAVELLANIAARNQQRQFLGDALGRHRRREIHDRGDRLLQPGAQRFWLGGGTRLKIVEAMAMGKAIVSTTLGAEGIEAVPGRDILIEDQPVAFADAVNRLLSEPSLAVHIRQSARRLGMLDFLQGPPMYTTR